MARQINLWRNQQLPGYGRLQLPAFINALFIALLAAGAWVGYSWYSYQQKLDEEALWQRNADQSAKTLALFKEMNPDLGNEQRLRELNEQYAAELQATREAYAGLVNEVENAIEGFSAPLAHLSDYDINGLWLDTILLKDGHRAFVLKGFARSPDLIPAYLDQLSNSTFSGLVVDQLSVIKDDNRSSLWRFGVSNDRSVNLQESD